jgi:hypothetical protein
MISRRLLLITTATIALIGCAPTPAPIVTPGPPQPQPSGDLGTLIGEVTDLAGGVVDKLLPLLGTITGLSQATADKIRTWSGVIEALAKQVGSSISLDQAKPLVQQIYPIVLQIIDALASVPGLPFPVTLLMSALSITLPIVMRLIGVTSLQARRTFPGFQPLTVEQAHQVLRTGSL